MMNKCEPFCHRKMGNSRAGPSSRTKGAAIQFLNGDEPILNIDSNYSLRHCEGVARGNPAFYKISSLRGALVATKQIKNWIATGYALAMTERVVTIDIYFT